MATSPKTPVATTKPSPTSRAPLPVLPTRTRKKRVQRQIEHAPERLRASIKTGMLIGILQRVAQGTKVVEPHQVTAAVALLKKTLPDLQATLLQGELDQRVTITTRML